MPTRLITLEVTDLAIELLRRLIDAAPSNPFLPLVSGVLPQLPLNTDAAACDRYLEYMRTKSAAAHVPAAEGSPAAPALSESAGGFQYRPWGSKPLPDILRGLLQTSSTPRVPGSGGGFREPAHTLLEAADPRWDDGSIASNE